MGDVAFGLFALGLLGLLIGAGYAVEAWQAKRTGAEADKETVRQVHALHERVVKALASRPEMERIERMERNKR